MPTSPWVSHPEGFTPCSSCAGTGSVSCGSCLGSGGSYDTRYEYDHYSGQSIPRQDWVSCSSCSGAGRRPCGDCGGTGSTLRVPGAANPTGQDSGLSAVQDPISSIKGVIGNLCTGISRYTGIDDKTKTYWMSCLEHVSILKIESLLLNEINTKKKSLAKHDPDLSILQMAAQRLVAYLRVAEANNYLGRARLEANKMIDSWRTEEAFVKKYGRPPTARDFANGRWEEIKSALKMSGRWLTWTT